VNVRDWQSGKHRPNARSVMRREMVLLNDVAWSRKGFKHNAAKPYACFLILSSNLRFNKYSDLCLFHSFRVLDS